MQRRLILRLSPALLALFMLVPWQAAQAAGRQAAQPAPGTDLTSAFRSTIESAYRKNNGIGFNPSTATPASAPRGRVPRL